MKRKKRIKERFTGCTKKPKIEGLFPKAQKLASLKQSALFHGKSPSISLRFFHDAGLI